MHQHTIVSSQVYVLTEGGPPCPQVLALRVLVHGAGRAPPVAARGRGELPPQDAVLRTPGPAAASGVAPAKVRQASSRLKEELLVAT